MWKNIKLTSLVVMISAVLSGIVMAEDKAPDDTGNVNLAPQSYELRFVIFQSALGSGNSESFEVSASVGQSLVGAGSSASFQIEVGLEPQIGASDCCIDVTGNVNCSGEEEPDISDITRLIDYLYLSHAPLCCPGEADANGSCDPEPDISDITKLIDYLYLSHMPCAPCSACP
ncbi:MAG: hypothetical protein JXA92_12510 [candidate division Zixibacteria bacterium]|nr:hypothetical protein [candidate division Zixibacteria bacterium]